MKYDANAHVPKWVYVCDRCRKEVATLYKVELHDCGLTGYTSIEEYCESCRDKFTGGR